MEIETGSREVAMIGGVQAERRTDGPRDSTKS
jgi:hypothetical protein